MWAYSAHGLINYIMIYVSQGMLKTVRDDLFRHMERLPIRYFDTEIPWGHYEYLYQ